MGSRTNFFVARRPWMQGGGAGAGGGVVTLIGLFGGGAKLTYVAAAGATNNVNPGGSWPSPSYGRIDVNTAAGACNFTGLVAATTDGQSVSIRNAGANNLTLNNLNAGSTAANRFSGVGDTVLLPGESIILVYDLTLALWMIEA